MVISVLMFPPFLYFRHCEERGDEAIHTFFPCQMDCLALLAMTALAVQNFSTHGRNSSSQVQALRGCRSTFQ
jgi:hypothetical protein